jgi:8-oxo-dGTP pyrophosphatase MutT (NUDIX family)
MGKVAKLVIIDNANKYLMMYRSAHPTYGNDPDLPGGAVESGEEPLDAVIREAYEEIGATIDSAAVKKIYEGSDYSRHNTHYSLYLVKLARRPDIIMSWEHSAYEWVERGSFLKIAKSANDTYMHMVYGELRQLSIL